MFFYIQFFSRIILPENDTIILDSLEVGGNANIAFLAQNQINNGYF